MFPLQRQQQSKFAATIARSVAHALSVACGRGNFESGKKNLRIQNILILVDGA